MVSDVLHRKKEALNNTPAPELEHPNINEFDIEEYEQGAFENSDDDGGVQL
jgi:hypothetical protein